MCGGKRVLANRVFNNEEEFFLFDEERNNESNNLENDILADLNNEQREAVLHTDGPILVLAGAGSGKTRVLTRRVANLVLNKGVYPSQILAVTFTNKATAEMVSRLSDLLGNEVNSLWVCTFHAMGAKILRRYAERLGYSNSFSIYDTKDTQNLIKKICKEQKIDDKKYTPDYIRGCISRAKNDFILPTEFEANVDANKYCSISILLQEKAVSRVYTEYQKELMALSAMDFDDLLLNTLKLFQNDKEVLQYYQNKFHYILVDEFQDTNEVQYKLMHLLAKERKNIFVVGDDDQSIYSFRGAKPTNILMFERDFDNTKVIKLEQNYRSTSNILSASNSIIAKNKIRKVKKLWTAGKEGDLITLYSALDENSEASFVASEIRKLVDEGGREYKDIACFYRTNAQSRALEEALVMNKIKYKIYGTLKFWDRKEIKDMVSYLRLVVNDSDDQAFLRVVNTPTRGIGAQTVANLMGSAKEHGTSLFKEARALNNPRLNVFVNLIDYLKSRARDVSLHRLLEIIYEASTYKAMLKNSKDQTAESRQENILELIAYAETISKGESDNEKAISLFMDKVALTGSDETFESKNTEDEEENAVSLMTVHIAKGLEFRVVFFTGLEEGLVPHARSLDEVEDLEEERRLCYVGMTRAMEKLYLTYAKKRTMYGSSSTSYLRKVSRFVSDIPKQLIEESGDEEVLGEFVFDSSFSSFKSKGKVGHKIKPVAKSDNYGEDSNNFGNNNYDNSNLERYMDINYNDAANLDFLPPIYKKKFFKDKKEKVDVLTDVLGLVQTATSLGEPIGNFRKLDASEVKVGLRVRHQNFGEGIIRDIQGNLKTQNPHKIKLCIDFDNEPKQKKLILGKACFEII